MSIRQEEVVSKAKRRNPLLIIVIALVVLAVGGAAYYLGGSRQPGEKPPPELQALELEPFTVNLADANYRRFLRVKITVEYSDKQLPGEVAKYRYKVRDAVIEVLRSKTVEEIGGQDQSAALRAEIVGEINRVLEHEVLDIYFEEFIIQ